MTKSEVYVSLEFTPNPNTLKYAVNRELSPQGAAHFSRKEDAEARSPLAAKLLAVQGIQSVMIGKDFVTINKTEDGDWDAVHQNASTLIEKHLQDDAPVFLAGAFEKPSTGGSSEVERKIQEILDNEIRPAVAMDGGDIRFDRFENGVVYVHLHGACSGCPGATATLKMGVESRLREEIPEVQEVIAL